MIQTTGRPSWAPGRSQAAAGGGAGGGSSAAGSSGPGGGANGPNPTRAATTNRIQTAKPRATKAMAISSGVALSEPIVRAVLALPVAIAASATSPPRATGPPIAKRISSRDHATGWSTFAATATTVSPTMIATNGRLPRPPPAGTLIAR